MRLISRLAAMILAASFASTAGASEWPFTAYLDGKEIGQHRFAIAENNGFLQLTSEADFTVKVLFINAYQYQHRAVELWQDDCLHSLEASTRENRDLSKVQGKRMEGEFRVEGPKGQLQLPACAMTFAYWNPKMLQQDKLLNPQTGEWLDVSIMKLGRESIEVRGRQVDARRYRLTAPKMKIDLWYSTDGQWLALESTTPEGYLISYKLR
jgi:hypothetical protein